MEIPNHNATLPAMLGHLSNSHGNRVLASDSRRSITFRRAEEASRELALGLLASGVGKGTRVGLLMANSPDWIVAWFAALRVGALVTGVSTFCKPPELARVLKLADIDTLLMQDNYLRHNYVQNMERALPGLASARGGPLRIAGAPYLRSVWVWGGAKPDWARGNHADLRALGRGASGLSAEFLAEAEAQVSPADLAVVIFTSGSTAEPKGVVHSHGTVVRHAYTMFDYAECAPGTRILVLTPFFWIGGMLTTLLNTMIGGAELICPERPDPEFILELLRRELPDQITGWAGQLTAIREHPDFRPEDFLRLNASHNTQRRAGVVGPPLEVPLPLVPNSLGMSESFGPHSGELDGVVLSEDGADSFGRAIDGIERKIVVPGGSEELPPGETGELLIRGYSIMQGYYKRERGECFEADGFFRTGDLCSITGDGHLFFHGRGGEMIKTSGANVSPREVELALLAYPEVAEAAVLGKPDRPVGEIVVAVVVPLPGERLDPEQLRRRLDADISSYKIPKLFVTDLLGEDLPRTDSGKVQKHELLEMIARRLDAKMAANT